MSVLILLTPTVLFDHIDNPNLVGFMFGEPLFKGNLRTLGYDRAPLPGEHP
ncbi:MAG: hypothetical protein WA948_07020 [Pontixanthobacter sp.]